MTIRLQPAYFHVGLIVVAAALILDASSVTAESMHERLWSNLLERPSGPGAFRFYMQPTMAAIAALRDGLHDARAGRLPYLWTVIMVPAERSTRLREGLRQTRRIMILGVVMEAAYQFAILKAFYPLEMILVVLLLCFVPYLLLRGPFTRIARRFVERTAP
jgi:hypothetical protein